MKIKKNDVVKVISGKQKGQQGKVIKLYRDKNKVVIENINIKTKHLKPKQNEDKGSITQIEGYIHKSNIKIISQDI